MAGKEKHFVFEVVADLVAVRAQIIDEIPAADLRVSLALADLPVIHISPKGLPNVLPNAEGLKTVNFGGNGKLCEFAMNKQDLETQNLVLLLLKEVSTINDFLILTMTAPISIRDLILSLPSSNMGEREAVPFVARRFSFIDETGTCSVRIRFTASLHDSMRKSQLQTTLRLHSSKPKESTMGDEPSEFQPPPTINQLIEETSQQISPSTLTTRSTIKYGGLHRRSPIIHN